MKTSLFMLLLFLHVGCATKYIISGNKFLTPESQGGVFNSQAEFHQASANQLSANLSNGSIEDGVEYVQVKRSGFLFSTSLLDQLDLIWSHTGSGNSLFGGKFQLFGASKTAKGVGHKVSLSAAFGGNQHKIEGEPTVEFKLNGQEYGIQYGYRFSEMFLVYSNFLHSTYQFSGEVFSSDASFDGLKPAYDTTVNSLLGGVEFDFLSLFAKLECGYQQLETTYTLEKSHFLFGYSIGLNW